MVAPLDTFQTFKYNFFVWRLLGLFPTEKNKFLYNCYSAFVNTVISIYYPLSLVVILFMVHKVKVLLEITSLNLAVLVCSMKAFNILFMKKQLVKVREYTSKLDARATDPEEEKLLRGVVRLCRNYFIFYCILYGAGVVTAEVSYQFSSERKLLYTAWFPFNWRESDRIYNIIHLYQIFGITFHITQNLADDTYPTFYICVLCGHVKALALRISRLGWDPTKTEDQHYQDLIACLNDHKVILEYCSVVQNVLSVVLLLQFLTSGVTLCLTAVYALFITENYLEIIYIIDFFAAMLMQITLPCYYGNQLMEITSELTTALYNCNWIDRNQKFKKALIIFMSKTQKNNGIYAANFIEVSFATFLRIMKTTYSLFAVLYQMKSKNNF